MRARRAARRERQANRVQEHMTLAEHLTELRSRLIKSMIAILLGGLVVFLLYNRILDFLTEPYQKICEGGDVTCPTGGSSPSPTPSRASRCA